ncbi:MAG: YraN family protein [Lysobacteraceae bacterium]
MTTAVLKRFAAAASRFAKTNPGQRGAEGERQAEAFLAAHGLSTVACNVRYRFGEIDLLMRDGDTLAFIEVRYRAGSGFGDGADSVDRRKQQRLAKAAAAWLAANPRWQRNACRFDVVALGGDPQQPDIDWIRNAFTLDGLT